MFNSKAWLSKYLPILSSHEPAQVDSAEGRSIQLAPKSPTASEDNYLLSNATDREHIIDIDELIDLDGQAWDWVDSDDEDYSNANLSDNLAGVDLDHVNTDFLWNETIAGTCCKLPEISREKTEQKVRSCLQKTPYYIPFLLWLPKYKIKEYLLTDILTGISIAAVIVPQGIAYSAIANVPAINGLYTSWMPPIMYSLLGGCRELAMGPEGVVSLLTGAAITVGFGDAGETDLYAYTVPRAAVLSFLVGLFTLCLGILRVGFLDNLISRPILHGFVSASAAIIFVGQLDSFLGFSVTQQEWKKLIGVAENLDKINWYSVGISTSSLIAILLIDFIKNRWGKTYGALKYIPTPLIIVAAATFITFIFQLQDKDVVVLGDIEGGFPIPKVPEFWNPVYLRELAVESILIGIVGFVEANAIAKTYSSLGAYEVSANRELVAFGVGNSVSSFFGAYPAFGSLARSKIQYSCGARTPLVGFIVSWVVLLTILFLTPLFYYLPKSCIAAIVMVAAGRLIEFHFKFLYQIRAWLEILLTLFTFFTTFFLGAEIGIILAIAISLFLVVKHTTLPSVSILGIAPDGKWRDVALFKDAQLMPGVLVVRIDESLYFGNIEQLVKMINRIVSLGRWDAHPTDATILQEAVFSLVIDARNIHSIDANAWGVLKEMLYDYKRRNIAVLFAHLKQDHILSLHQADLTKELVPLEHLHNSINSAVKYAHTYVRKID